jgi:hypothetical protein
MDFLADAQTTVSKVGGDCTVKTLTIAPAPHINAWFGTTKLTPHSAEFRAHVAECHKIAACLVRPHQRTVPVVGGGRARETLGRAVIVGWTEVITPTAKQLVGIVLAIAIAIVSASAFGINAAEHSATQVPTKQLHDFKG